MLASLIRYTPLLLLGGLGIYCAIKAASPGPQAPTPPPKLVIQQMGNTLEGCLRHYEGHPVVLLVNAHWGLQGAVIEHFLGTPEVAAACFPYNAVVVIADMTARDEDLDQLLQIHKQPGLPYMMVYPADRSKPPVEVQGIFGDATALAKNIQSALELSES
jgi:thiol:disulfide interchange protein